LSFSGKFCALFILFLDDHENLGLSGVPKNVCAFVRDRDRDMYRSRMASMPRAISKRALLVGCNYPGSGPGELTGCWNDVRVTRDRLINRFGFQAHDICLLVDLPHRSPQPTWAVIKQHLRLLFRDMQAGDVLVFQFFGQSVQVCKNANTCSFTVTDYIRVLPI
jgi:hypothetical protein